MSDYKLVDFSINERIEITHQCYTEEEATEEESIEEETENEVTVTNSIALNDEMYNKDGIVNPKEFRNLTFCNLIKIDEKLSYICECRFPHGVPESILDFICENAHKCKNHLLILNILHKFADPPYNITFQTHEIANFIAFLTNNMQTRELALKIVIKYISLDSVLWPEEYFLELLEKSIQIEHQSTSTVWLTMCFLVTKIDFCQKSEIMVSLFQKAYEGTINEKSAALKLLLCILVSNNEECNDLIAANVKLFNDFLNICCDFNVFEVIKIHSLIRENIKLTYPLFDFEQE